MIRKTFAWLLLAGLAGAAAQAQTVDEIINKHLEARGGKDKIKAVQSARMTGKMVLQGQGIEAPITMELERPGKMRMEFTIQGMTGISAYDGKKGWSVMPFMGKTEPEVMSDDEIRQAEDQADMDGMLVDYKEKGHKVELVGKEDVEGTPAYKLRVTKKNGDVVDVYIDTDSYMDIRESGKVKVRGQEIESQTTFGDFKKVDGLVFPYSIEQKPQGAPAGMVLTLSNIELNPTLADSRFTMPAAKPADKPADEKKDAPAPPKP